MKNIIIGTAGHVDHGKTLLIKALTGVDTDRLKEEKKRGITIENGFASLPNDLDLNLGIIDVPGHEKFVKNMLSGIGGIDIVLFIISLEEGIKPQTIEHFEIVKSLGIQKGIVVFTKLDSENKVDFENLKRDVKELLKGSNLEDSKMISVSSITGKNINELKQIIFDLAKEIRDRNYKKELTRLNIDRVFTMEGFGTVITGTLIEGQIDTGDELMLYPSQRIVKVRQIQSFGKVRPSAYAGQRTAINLANIKKEEILKGDVLATKSSIILSDVIDCKIKMFDYSTRKIKNGEKLHFNYGAKQTEAIVRVINDEYVQFKFDTPIPVKRNDKYIVRFVSPTMTCAGGVILNIDSKRYKLDGNNALNHFKALDTDDKNSVLLEIISDVSVRFPNAVYLAQKMNDSIENVNSYVDSLLHSKRIIVLNLNKGNNKDKNNCIILSIKFYEGTKRYILDILNKYHKDNPISQGMKKDVLKGLLFKRYTTVGDTAFEALLNYMANEKIINQKDDLIFEYSFEVIINEGQANDISKIEHKYKEAKFEPPKTNEFVDEFAKNSSFNDKKHIYQILVDLAKNNKLVKLTNDYYIHKSSYDEALSIVNKYFETHDKMLLREFRDLLQTSRKYAILLLDYMDSKKITKLIEDYRIKL